MYQKIGVTPNAMCHRVYDLDTGKEIEHCIEADDVIGRYVIYIIDEQDNLVIEDYPGGRRIKTETKWGNIKLVHRDHWHEWKK